MKKYIKEIILILSVIIGTVIVLEYNRAVVVSMWQNRVKAEAEPITEAGTELETILGIETISETVTAAVANITSETLSENTDSDDETYNNEEIFYKHAEEQGIDCSETDKYWDMLLADNLFKDDTMLLTGLVIDDMDDNGANDLLVMIRKREDWAFYGTGCVWFYMNDDKPCCFDSEDCPYYGHFEFFAEDIDNDSNVELVLSAHGTGCGAVGDTYKVIFKYKDHGIEQMELPSDLEIDYDQGINISVMQEAEKNRYSAYCSYFDEEILFESENIFEPSSSRCVGGNVRGFYDLSPVKYQGKNALQASEYLSGEGGNVHNVATAKFIILWDENGQSYIDRWWIETDENTLKQEMWNEIY